MGPIYELICYEPGLKGQVIELQSHLWSPDPVLNTAYFEWKYERNPYVDSPLIYLATHAGKVVGMRGFFGMQWEGGFPTEKCVALYADDLVIAPEHRNHGLIGKIMAAAFEDLADRKHQYALNASAGPMNVLSSLAAGWRNVGSMAPMRRRSWRSALRDHRAQLIARLPLLSRGMQEAQPRRIEKRRRSFVDIDTGRVRHSLKGFSDVIFEQVPRSEAMAELIERIGSDGRVRQVRDRRYFDWRFENPQSRYRYIFWEKRRLEGYLVLQEYTSGYADPEVVNIVDCEASSVAVQSELLQAAVNLIADRGLTIWSVSLPPETKVLLAEKGFKPLPQSKSAAQQSDMLLIRRVGDRGPVSDWIAAGRPLLEMSSWDLRMLYSTRG